MTTTVQILVLPGGELQIFVDGDVTETQAAAITEQLVTRLRLGGVEFAKVGEVELHRTGAEHAHVINTQKESHG